MSNPIGGVYYWVSRPNTVGEKHDVPCPSSFTYELEDISENDAGRTEDFLMQKKRVGQAVKLKLEWQNVSTAIAQTVLNAFNAEYIVVEYLDPYAGDYVKREFYVGNRSAPLYNAAMGIWSKISFNLIERGVNGAIDVTVSSQS